MKKLCYKPNARNYSGVKMWRAEDYFGTFMLQQDSLSIRHFILRLSVAASDDWRKNLINGIHVDDFSRFVITING